MIPFRDTALGAVLSGLRRFKLIYLTNYRKKFGHCDKSATVSKPLIIKGAKNIFLHENTKIVEAVIMATNAKFVLKRGTQTTEGLTVITGNHERRVGRFFYSIKEHEKSPESDKDVIVEEDCWIGVNTTLLSGVTIRRGSTVAAGSVVTKSCAPYSIIGGVPAKHIKFYWTIEEILAHEQALYKPDERYSKSQLEDFFKLYS